MKKKVLYSILSIFLVCIIGSRLYYLKKYQKYLPPTNKQLPSRPAESNSSFILNKNGDIHVKINNTDEATIASPKFKDCTLTSSEYNEVIPYKSITHGNFRIQSNSGSMVSSNITNDKISLKFNKGEDIRITSPLIPIPRKEKMYRINFNYTINSEMPITEKGKLAVSNCYVHIFYYGLNKKYLYDETVPLGVFRTYKNINNFNYSFIPSKQTAFFSISFDPYRLFTGDYTLNKMYLYRYDIYNVQRKSYNYMVRQTKNAKKIIQNFNYGTRNVKRIITFNLLQKTISIQKTIKYNTDVQALQEFDPIFVKSKNIRLIGRDLNIKDNLTIGKPYVTDYTTPYFTNFDNLTLNCFNGYSSIETSKYDMGYAVQIYNTKDADNKYFTIGDGGCREYIYTNKFNKNSTSNINYSFYYGNNQDIIIPSRSPNCTHGTLALSSHGDSTIPRTTMAMMYGSSNLKSPLFNKSGFITYKIPITWSFFPYYGEFGLNNKYLNVILTRMHKSGIEVLPHTISSVTNENTRQLLQEYLPKLTKFGVTDWIDHSLGAGGKCADIKSDGANPKSPNFSLDLFKKYNYKYCWSYLDVTLKNNFNMLENPANRDQIIFKNNNLGYGDYSLYQWNTYRPNDLLKELNKKDLQQLVDQNGVMLIHDYFGHVKQRNHFFTMDSDGHYTLTPGFDNALKLMTTFRKDKKLWIPSVKDYMDYTIKIHNLDIKYNGSALIINNKNNTTLNGFTYIKYNAETGTKGYVSINLNPGLTTIK